MLCVTPRFMFWSQRFMLTCCARRLTSDEAAQIDIGRKMKEDVYTAVLEMITGSRNVTSRYYPSITADVG